MVPASNRVHSVSPSHEDRVARLQSLHDGDAAAIDLMAAGPSVIPAVRAFLFQRERSGIYQPRRWSVDVLAALHAYGVLKDYLKRPRIATDPVERAGDEAVANAAARALSMVREEWVFGLMLDLAEWHLTSGVVNALGSFDRLEAIPRLIDALAEDDCRTIAEAALQRLGAAAVPALIQVALRSTPPPESESETSLRQRRSALRVLGDSPLTPSQWRLIRPLLADQDARVAVLACGLCPSNAERDDKASAIRRLNELLPSADWVLAMEVRHRLDDLHEVDET